jgi:hypothetical protein
MARSPEPRCRRITKFEGNPRTIEIQAGCVLGVLRQTSLAVAFNPLKKDIDKNTMSLLLIVYRVSMSE